jgi:hypothetical protein
MIMGEKDMNKDNNKGNSSIPLYYNSMSIKSVRIMSIDGKVDLSLPDHIGINRMLPDFGLFVSEIYNTDKNW